MSSTETGRMTVIAALAVWLVGYSSLAAQQPGVRPEQPFPSPGDVASGTQRPPVRPGGQQHNAAPPGAVNPRPGAPFVLTPPQRQDLDRVLAAWERAGAGVETLSVEFTRFEYDKTFKKKTTSEGVLKYKKPDRGLYRIDKVFQIDPSTNVQRQIQGRTEHWVCNGQSTFEFNAAKKQLIERPIPPEMRGKAISDGPLPFLFDMTAAKLKQRYFMRITSTVRERAKGHIFIEAFPRFQRDAANFARAEIILDVGDLSVQALKIVLPNGTSETVHVFDKVAKNSPWAILAPDFANPSPPFGWQHVVERAPAGRPPVRAAAPPRQGPSDHGAPLR